ncbi:MAG: hydrolase [Candidatus Dadabacteria bacterium]|nr:hydrolase [Candidatus Dadabacteria bacterium]
MDFIKRDSISLLIIDMQEKLINAIPLDSRESTIRNSNILIETAKTLNIPIMLTEQYPKGLGLTIPEIKEAVGERFKPIEKLVFSCARSPEFKSTLKETRREEVLVCGIETHVCVLQTVLDLINHGYKIHVPADAVASRKEFDWKTGINLIDRAGATVGTTETFVFQLLERAGTEEFKKISKLIK